jgi:hypothetical protein
MRSNRTLALASNCGKGSSSSEGVLCHRHERIGVGRPSVEEVPELVKLDAHLYPGADGPMRAGIEAGDMLAADPNLEM